MFDIERFNKIRSKIKYNSDQSNIAMSNKYFKIFNQLVKDGKLKKSHVGYTYSYMYLITYLFRYTKYENVVLSTKEIKELLMYNPNNKTIDYITKQDGLLDDANLTITLFDFPVVHELVDGHLEFTMLSDFNDNNSYGTDWRKLHGINFNQSCKYPILAFYDDIGSAEFSINNLGGTFFNSEFTTIIPFEVFMYCMSHSELGTTGFYIYCFIAFQNGIKGNCKMSINNLAINCNMSIKPMQKYINTLRQYNLIKTTVADEFIIGDSKKGDANTHFHNDFDEFVKDDNLIQLQKPNFVNVSNLEKYSSNVDTIDFW